MTDPQPADEPAAPRPHARRRRLPGKWALLAAFWLVQAATIYLVAVVWIGNSFEVSSTTPWGTWFRPSDVLQAAARRDSLRVMGTYTAIVTVLQAFILFPARRPTLSRDRGASLWASFAAVGLTIAAAWTALVFSIISLVHFAPWSQATRSGAGQAQWLDQLLTSLGVGWWALALPLLPGWIVGTLVVASFCRRGRRESALARLSVRILQGTAIEVVAIIPLDVMIRRRTDCYCDTGTFWSLTLCGTVGAVLTGPAILLPLLAKRRRRWYQGRCEVCGYDMHGLQAADRCPECGTGWAVAATGHVEEK
jgi:hypothetical protein